MTDLVNSAPEIIQSIGDSPVRLTAYILLIICFFAITVFPQVPQQDRTNLALQFMGFAIILFITLLQFSNAQPQTFDSTSQSSKMHIPKWVWINWIGLAIAFLGLIEFGSIMRLSLTRRVSFVPGLTLLIFGMNLILMPPEFMKTSIGFILIRVVSRLTGAFGIALLSEGLLHSSEYEITIQRATVYVGLFTLFLSFTFLSLVG